MLFHALSVSSLFTPYAPARSLPWDAQLKHHFFPPRQAILDTLHDHAQILLAAHEVQIVAADTSPAFWCRVV
jgi:hypothetical protein